MLKTTKINWNPPLKGSPPVSYNWYLHILSFQWRRSQYFKICLYVRDKMEVDETVAVTKSPNAWATRWDLLVLCLRRVSHTIHLWSHFYCWCFCESLFLTTPRWWIKGLWLRRMHWCETERRRGRLMGIERKVQGWWRSKVLFIESLYSHQSLLSSPVGLIFTLWDAAAEI